MKRISLKWKLTILYTLLITLLTGLVLAVLLSLGSGRLLASAQAALRQRVVAGEPGGKSDGGLGFFGPGRRYISVRLR